jgi:hypothetical protein
MVLGLCNRSFQAFLPLMIRFQFLSFHFFCCVRWSSPKSAWFRCCRFQSTRFLWDQFASLTLNPLNYGEPLSGFSPLIECSRFKTPESHRTPSTDCCCYSQNCPRGDSRSICWHSWFSDGVSLILLRIYMGIDILPETLPSFGPDMPFTMRYQVIKNFPTQTIGYRTMFTAT